MTHFPALVRLTTSRIFPFSPPPSNKHEKTSIKPFTSDARIIIILRIYKLWYHPEFYHFSNNTVRFEKSSTASSLSLFLFLSLSSSVSPLRMFREDSYLKRSFLKRKPQTFINTWWLEACASRFAVARDSRRRHRRCLDARTRIGGGIGKMDRRGNESVKGACFHDDLARLERKNWWQFRSRGIVFDRNHVLHDARAFFFRGPWTPFRPDRYVKRGEENRHEGGRDFSFVRGGRAVRTATGGSDRIHESHDSRYVHSVSFFIPQLPLLTESSLSSPFAACIHFFAICRRSLRFVFSSKIYLWIFVKGELMTRNDTFGETARW